ncbi:MAG: hypothetical protein A2Y93_17490 [Chloroflexi bacterium RBG_13_68_17]|nr:MAG: hypothetical protein A2Y93_17490 [Chloroflexi bacterium RBG_13_68_17]
MRTRTATVGILILGLLATPVVATAQEPLSLEVTVQASCDAVSFGIVVEGGTPPYVISLDYGDGIVDVGGADDAFSHVYTAAGEYPWSLVLTDSAGAEMTTDGSIDLEFPSVTLTSEPFPPLLTLMDGEARAEFAAGVEGGTEPYTYAWDMDGDAMADAELAGPTASSLYTQAGDFWVAVQVTDAIGCTATETLEVVVIDPEEDQDACHPMALRIAEAVSGLFPTRAERIYTCEDILAIFDGEVFGFQVGFGRLWHAYQLTQKIDDLTWEQIRDWHLDGGGWGGLLQLDRFADLLETHSLLDLMELVASEEYTLGDIRTAVRSVTRYDADFDEVLARLESGASAGEIGQFYRLAQDLGADPATLDGYLGEGASLSDLRHAAGLADRLGTTWAAVMDARGDSNGWGDITQAYRLAGDGYSPEDILAIGVHEFRTQEREQDRAARETELNARAAERLAGQFEVEIAEGTALFNGDCVQSWGCVRDTLQNQSQGSSDRTQRSAAQIAAQYGYSLDEVLGVFNGTCAGSWSCVRTHFRNLSRSGGGGNNH